MYSKFVDHLAIAFDFYKKADNQSASTAIKAAFESPDADKSVGMLLRRNNVAFRASAAQDIGLDFEVPGDDLRVPPDAKVTATEDNDEDDVSVEEPSEEVQASMKRLTTRKATAAAKPASSTLKDRYFASLRAK
jgi:hypothetical protein